VRSVGPPVRAGDRCHARWVRARFPDTTGASCWMLGTTLVTAAIISTTFEFFVQSRTLPLVTRYVGQLIITHCVTRAQPSMRTRIQGFAELTIFKVECLKGGAQSTSGSASCFLLTRRKRIRHDLPVIGALSATPWLPFWVTQTCVDRGHSLPHAGAAVLGRTGGRGSPA
jgi:hypothetical protein